MKTEGWGTQLRFKWRVKVRKYICLSYVLPMKIMLHVYWGPSLYILLWQVLLEINMWDGFLPAERWKETPSTLSINVFLIIHIFSRLFCDLKTYKKEEKQSLKSVIFLEMFPFLFVIYFSFWSILSVKSQSRLLIC